MWNETSNQPHLIDALNAIRKVHHLIVKERNVHTIVNRVCTLLTETPCYQSAWIGLIGDDGKFYAAAESGLNHSFEEIQFRLLHGWTPACFEKSLTRDHPFFQPKTASSCETCLFRNLHRGYSILTAGIGYDEHVFGIIAVSLPENIARNPDEQQMFQEMADDIGLALHSIRTEQERLQGVAEIQRIKDNFMLAFKSSPAALAITRITDGKFMIINEAYTRIMGYLPEQIVGKTVAELNIYVNDNERINLMRSLKEHGAVQNYLLRARTQSGQIRSLQVNMEKTVFDEEQAIISTFTDLTDTLKMEENLRESRQHFATIFQANPAAISISRMRDSRLIDANDAFLRLYAWDPGGHHQAKTR